MDHRNSVITSSDKRAADWLLPQNTGQRPGTITGTASDPVYCQPDVIKAMDNETGLDYFGARYYANVQGRFTSVDPLMASGITHRPQSLNRYAYVYNNPLRLIDPNGMMAEPPSGVPSGARDGGGGGGFGSFGAGQWSDITTSGVVSATTHESVHTDTTDHAGTSGDHTDASPDHSEGAPQNPSCDPVFFPDDTTYQIGQRSFTGADLNIAARVVYAESSRGTRLYDGQYLGDKVNDERDGIASVLYNFLTELRLTTFHDVAYSGRFNTVTVTGETGDFVGSAPGSYQKLGEAQVNSKGLVYGGECNDLRSSVDAIRRMVNNNGPRYDFTRFRANTTPLTYNGHTATVLGNSRFGYAGYFPEGRR